MMDAKMLLDYVRKAEPRAGDMDLREAASVRFLAAGEYNRNYTVHAASGEPLCVLRLNTASQIGLGHRQTRYEFDTLKAIEHLRIAPRAYWVDDSFDRLESGVIFMEYIQGRPLTYDADDLKLMAGALAKLHAYHPPAGSHFLPRGDALLGVVEEASAFIADYLDYKRGHTEVKRDLSTLLASANAAARAHGHLFADPDTIIHNDPQADNFIFDARTGTARLVDWERSLVDDPSYDLAIFVSPTNTLWKRDEILTEEKISVFFDTYYETFGNDWTKEMREKVRVRTPFVCLRAVSWCAHAFVEYAENPRKIRHDDTFRKIQMYLETEFMRDLFGRHDWI